MEFEHDDNDELKSKTQVKKEMLALQDLGEKLTEMPRRQLDKCELPDELLHAIEEYKRIPNKRGARKRQLQFIGKLMRDIDPEPIQRVLDEEGQQAEREKRRFHRLETLREELLGGENDVLDTLIRMNPGMDIQYFRQLIRQATKEAAENKPPAASRKLFACLRELENIPW